MLPDAAFSSTTAAVVLVNLFRHRLHTDFRSDRRSNVYYFLLNAYCDDLYFPSAGCSFICGWKWGGCVGRRRPIVR